MPRKYVKKKTVARYSQEDLSRAVSDVRNKNCTYRQASQLYNVPVAVIFHRIKGRNVPESKMGAGRSTVLSTEIEEQIVECLKARARMGYPCNKEELRDLVATFVQQRDLKTPFKDGRPGLDWYYSFMSRHKTLSYKKPEHLQKARKDQRKPEVIYNFYNKLKEIYLEQQIDNAAFVFNADESGFGNDPSRIKAIGERGKTLSRVSGGSGRDSTSVLACIAADGSFLPPFIVFKGAAVQARWTSPNAYPGTVYSVSANGWMEEPQFFNWFQSVFVKWVEDLRISKNLPDQKALLMYDGHKSHISLRIIECALAHRIVLVKFPSHLTDRLQPLDKCVFGPVKTAWEKKLISYGKKHMGHGAGRLKKNEFTDLLGEVWKESFSEKNIKSGFENTGMFPCNSKKFPEDEFNPIDLKRFKDSQRRVDQSAEPQQREGNATEDNNSKEISADVRADSLQPCPSTSAEDNNGNEISADVREDILQPCPSTSTLSASDIVAVFSTAISKTLNVNSNTNHEQKKVTPRLKQAHYGEVLTTNAVIERLKEAERAKEEKIARKSKPRSKKAPKEQLKRKRKESSESEEEIDEVPYADNSDEEMNQDEWAEEIAADLCPVVEYAVPEFHLIQPGRFVLAKFLGGSRKATIYKYVCRIRDVDEESGEIEVVGFRRNDKFATEFVEKTTDISSIDLEMVEALLPEPKKIVRERKIIYVFYGRIDVFEK